VIEKKRNSNLVRCSFRFLLFFCCYCKDERTDKRTLLQKGEKKKVKRRSHTFEEEKE